MAEQQTIEAYLAKAEENLACAESEFTSQRYNSCANRCYYACFQAALAALLRAGVGSGGTSDQWRHGYVQAAFEGQLIQRRKLYPSSLRNVLSTARDLRDTADYEPDPVTRKQAERVLRRCREFVRAVGAVGREVQ